MVVISPPKPLKKPTRVQAELFGVGSESELGNERRAVCVKALLSCAVDGWFTAAP